MAVGTRWAPSPDQLTRRQIGCVEVILAGNPDKGKKRVTPGIGQRGAHALRGCSLADRAHWPMGRDPFARGMGEEGDQPDEASLLIHSRGLHRRYLMPA